MLKLIKFKLFIFLLLSIYGSANENNNTILSNTIDQAISSRNYISDKIVNYAKKIDYYISNKNEIKKNSTRIIMQLSYLNEEGEESIFERDIKLRLKLPNTQENLKLVFIDEIDENENTVKNDRKEEENIQTVALEYEFKKSLKGSLGLKLGSNSDLYLKLNYKNILKKNKSNLARFKQEIRYFTNGELTNTSSLNFNRNLSDVYKISLSNIFTWERKSDINNLLHILSLTNKLNDKSYLSYSISKHRNDEESDFKTKEYELGLKYHYDIKKWINFEVIPSLKYKDENNYASTKQMMLNFSILFAE